jgi:hypothetical protein
MTIREPGHPFCKIFVNAAEISSVTEMVAVLLGGQFERRSMHLPGIWVDVRSNPDRAEAGDDFVHWPVLIELEADDVGDVRTVVDAATRIITALWEAGDPAVAACDFEDELPWNGGIARLIG